MQGWGDSAWNPMRTIPGSLCSKRTTGVQALHREPKIQKLRLETADNL